MRVENLLYSKVTTLLKYFPYFCKSRKLEESE